MESDLPTMFCLTCKYALCGLPESRCPECGREFQPEDPRSYWDGQATRPWREAARFAGRAATTPFVVISLMWLIPAFFGGTIAGIYGGGAMATNFLRRRWKSGASILLLSPFFVIPTVLLCTGALDYWRGTGKLQSMRDPTSALGSVHPVYRCQTSYRCSNSIPDRSYDLSLTTLIRTLGPMKGSYTGPFPTREECLDALKEAEPVDAVELLNDQVHLVGRTVNLDPGVGLRLLGYCGRNQIPKHREDLEEFRQQMGSITAVMDGECLILSLPEHTKRPNAIVALIDSVSGRPFSYYAKDSDFLFYVLVPWREP